MDFRQTTQAPSAPRPVVAAPAPVVTEQKLTEDPKVSKKNASWLHLATFIVLVVIALGVAGVVVTLAQGNKTASAANKAADNGFASVKTNTYQAVFLSNGQVYFGKVTGITDKNIRLTDVYYLSQNASTSTTSTTSSYTLLQLGCQQIHYPEDAMMINQSQVTFWENLVDKDGNQVLAKIKQAKSQAVDCTQVSSQTQASGTATQGATATPTK